MRISRLTIDKLGIQMYDRVSAVLAELIANAYDADAEHVKISLPFFGQYLARRVKGQVVDQGFEIVIEDDGAGMTAQEVNEYYLNVGYNRRVGRGERTPKLNRRVMGRKGIGKLAPFGICHEVEVVSAGGDRTDCGYAVSNLILDLDKMLQEKTDKFGNVLPYHPRPGTEDESYSDSAGTKLILRRFDRRRVPTRDELDRQLAARFGLSQSNWSVRLEDSTGDGDPIDIGTLNVDVMSGTRIEVDSRPVEVDGQFLPVSGWVAYAKDPYKDEVMAGVRLYARGKIVAQTRDFDIKTGFTGEFKMRSYLTGAIHAEWLDDEEDFIRTDRQDIIWNSDLGTPLREWGRELLKELASKAEVSAGRRVWDIFLEKSKLQERLELALPSDRDVRESIMRAARSLVTRADRDSMQNPRFVERVVNLAFTVGPHRTLLETLDKIASMAHESADEILDLFDKARVVEMYSLGQVARERVEAIGQLRRLVSAQSTVEKQLQKLLERAPWILYPDWTPLSFNQSLARTRESFESWYQAKYGHEIVTSAIANPRKQPDFVMLNHEGRLEVIEIKRPQHSLTDGEFGRAFGYLTAVRDFIDETTEVRTLFRKAQLTIVCDSLNLDAMGQNTIRTDDEVSHKTWFDLLQSTSRSHEDFLKVVREMQGELPKLPVEQE
ncbi:MAG: ATP-binding protein [Chloroflexi bacterium]|nr:ATP-binding protein [Chloroflexota bacterium]MCY3939238.1 ATP-binding protein [Chloroflexota bacterium]